jgi:hypothetical protein
MVAWFKTQLQIMRDIIVGLVPIANLPRKFISFDEGGEHPNMVRLRIYRDDDNNFIENGQAFLKAVSGIDLGGSQSSTIKHWSNRIIA